MPISQMSTQKRLNPTGGVDVNFFRHGSQNLVRYNVTLDKVACWIRVGKGPWLGTTQVKLAENLKTTSVFYQLTFDERSYDSSGQIDLLRADEESCFVQRVKELS